jgi:Tol biopolymer transport system component
VFREIVPKTGYDISVLALGTPRRATPLLQTPFTEYNPEVSPDGRWLAYESNESGQFEVYVRPFPDVSAGRWQVSTSGGRQPLWARNGRELFYVSLAAAGRIMAVPVQPGTTFSFGNPQMIVDKPFGGTPGSTAVTLSGRTYDVSADGQRFLMIKSPVPSDAGGTGHIVVVQHWDAELTRLVPTN